MIVFLFDPAKNDGILLSLLTALTQYQHQLPEMCLLERVKKGYFNNGIF
jgi:hypothetical protein